MKTLILFLTLTILNGTGIVPASEAAPPVERQRIEELTLEQALELAESRQPELAEARALVEAAAGRAQQAGAFPNPDAIVGAQQLPLDGPNQREYVAGVGQTIPLGGRFSKARQAELLDREVRARGLDLKRRELRKQVQSAFATALYQDRALQAVSQLDGFAASTLAQAQARLEAGEALPEEVARAEMDRARTRASLARSTALREQSLAALTTTIGDPNVAVISLAGSLEEAFELPSLESLAADLSAHPAAALAEVDVQAKNARVDLARAERIPDVKVEALYHRLEGTRQNTVDLGLSIPLPLFHRNEGRVREARAEARAAEARAKATQNELNLRMREAYTHLTAALETSQTLRNEILPRADRVRRAAEARYEAGDISLVEVLPVRRDWTSLQMDYLESLRAALQAWAELSPYLKSP